MSFSNSIRSIAVATAIALAPATALAVHDNVIPVPIIKSKIKIALETVDIHPELNAPVWATYAPGLPGYLFVVDQDGQIFAKPLSGGDTSVFLDVSSLIVPLGARPTIGLTFDERGLVGLAFHPNFDSNGKFYTFTSEPLPADPVANPADFSTTPGAPKEFLFAGATLTVPNHRSVVSEWTADDAANPGAGVTGGRRVLLTVDEPQFNHNSGAIVFDKDGKLLIALGDGGGADDQPAVDLQDFIGVPILGHGALGNGQNGGNVLGTILRIDVDGNNSANGQYSVPDDNPFYPGGAGTAGGQAGCQDGACDEIWALGFRNIFRISVDMGGDHNVFAADVGQNDIEEIDVVVKGGNYGWPIKEGTFLFNHNGADEANGLAFTTVNSPGSPPNMIDPVAQYDHDEGVAVLGGFVVRDGSKLEGLYVFAEFAQPPFDPFAPNCDGRVFHLNNAVSDADVADIAANDFDGNIREFRGNVAAGLCLLGLGQDANGSVYVLGNDTGVPIGSTGTVTKIVVQ